MRLAIAVCATDKYAYAMRTQARRVQAAIGQIPEGAIIIVGDKSGKLKDVAEIYKRILPEKWRTNVHLIAEQLADNHENYKEAAQFLIAKMRETAFTKARELDAEFCLSMDSDVLPPSNAIRCMFDALAFDRGYYSVASCTYVSQSGGGFLGGHGSPQKQILPDFTEDERQVPEPIVKELKNLRDFLAKPIKCEEFTDEKRAELDSKAKRLQELEKDLDKYPPKGNVFAMNAIEWRRRGWLDQAYPAIGEGAILPTDWCGFGMTMMNREALSCAHFDSYGLGGTEDLHVVWTRWHQRHVRICVLTHCPCGHVIREKDKTGKPTGKYIQCEPYFETDPRYLGHLRVRRVPFLDFSLDSQLHLPDAPKSSP